jgi:hypothetical protein
MRGQHTFQSVNTIRNDAFVDLPYGGCMSKKLVERVRSVKIRCALWPSASRGTACAAGERHADAAAVRVERLQCDSRASKYGPYTRRQLDRIHISRRFNDALMAILRSDKES